MPNECPDPSQNASNKINSFVEKFSVWIVSIVVALLWFLYTTAIDRVSTLESRVSLLAQEKVSRAELKTITDELRQQNIETKRDIISQQETMKSDILSRLDYILKIQQGSSPTQPK